ncbi:hypothetical protein ASN18_0888 [Candidatus Magnetominusculus xianensis]|uniref:Uncharacterized protein n=1 Tax=Candidatus Magnetominusculus xianensis TaxID=1748249 RepID=A0ABR5SJB6_9BACT|nr:hypothetical protein ASN18_0888 [Candidatus Magnetominusculus xianensis]
MDRLYLGSALRFSYSHQGAEIQICAKIHIILYVYCKIGCQMAKNAGNSEKRLDKFTHYAVHSQMDSALNSAYISDLFQKARV